MEEIGFRPPHSGLSLTVVVYVQGHVANPGHPILLHVIEKKKRVEYQNGNHSNTPPFVTVPSMGKF